MTLHLTLYITGWRYIIGREGKKKKGKITSALYH